MKKLKTKNFPAPSICEPSPLHTHPPAPPRFVLLFKTSLPHGRLCEPILNFDTPKGGAVCVGGQASNVSPAPFLFSAPSAETPRALREPAGNVTFGEFPCRVRSHGALPPGVAGAARGVFEGAGRRVLRGLEYVRRRLARSTGIDTGSFGMDTDARGGDGREQRGEKRAFSI